MATKATIYKASLQIVDLDRNYYHDHTLTIARHPSETDERMMVRLLAFIHHACEDLKFTRGLSTNDEPDLWQKDLTDAIDLWIELGQPDEKRIRKACARAQQVCIYSYSGRSAEIWWEQIRSATGKLKNLTVINISPEISQSLAQLAQRTMQLQCTVQDGQIWITNNTGSVQVDFTYWLQP
ncbi:MAG: hypothetical protein GQ537_02385 [Gammaproteobacteria bacterium]|nr:hypothetical protein [Gammaproteobacteria bacterium]